MNSILRETKKCPSCISSRNVTKSDLNDGERIYYCKKCDLAFKEGDTAQTYKTNVLKELMILKESLSLLEEEIFRKQSEPETFELKEKETFELGGKETFKIEPEIKIEIDEIPIEEWGEAAYEDRKDDGRIRRSSPNMIKKIINMRKKDELKSDRDLAQIVKAKAFSISRRKPYISKGFEGFKLGKDEVKSDE